MIDLVLASSSPRRADLLRQINLSFRVVTPEVSEAWEPGEDATDYVTRLAAHKAEAVRDSLEDNPVIIGADTVVVLDNRILGKPVDMEDAVTMLMNLSGRRHSVITGVSLVQGTSTWTGSTETIVTFRDLTIEECRRYWETGEPRDKAGAYGIQGLGAIFVASIEGSYSNVVGLPLAETAHGLLQFGIDCLDEKNLNRKDGK
ncbi:MAG: septum formation inhibitor Maf [Pseudomonadales bacterium]|nr:septum formation inhibitor Maf [Pseudomonadales bacterium]